MAPKSCKFRLNEEISSNPSLYETFLSGTVCHERHRSLVLKPTVSSQYYLSLRVLTTKCTFLMYYNIVILRACAHSRPLRCGGFALCAIRWWRSTSCPSTCCQRRCSRATSELTQLLLCQQGHAEGQRPEHRGALVPVQSTQLCAAQHRRGWR